MTIAISTAAALALSALGLTGAVAAARQDPAPPAGFTREAAVDRPGNDLRMVEIAPRDAEACAAACRTDTRCRAFTVYTPPPHDKGFCWLKEAEGQPSVAPYAISAVRTRSPQEAGWTLIGHVNSNVFFVLGGAETRRGSRDISVAVVPPRGEMRNGRAVSYFVVFARVDCSAWTQLATSTHYYGSDGRVFDIAWAERTEPARIAAGTGMQTAAEMKCRSRAGQGAPIPQSQFSQFVENLRRQ